jgi:hypothetical protein
MDTVTLISAIPGLLAAADAELEIDLRAVLACDDDFAPAGHLHGGPRRMAWA